MSNAWLPIIVHNVIRKLRFPYAIYNTCVPIVASGCACADHPLAEALTGVVRPIWRRQRPYALLTYAAFGGGALVGSAFDRIGGRNKPGCAISVVQRTRDWRTRTTA